MSSLKQIFKKNRNIIIGAIHFPPLLGYKNFPGFDVALGNALADLKAFEKAGLDGVIFENNYDTPHKEIVDSSIIACMTYLGEKIKFATQLPVGVNVLWNDYKAGLSIAKVLDLQFIRIPVFVDRVKTKDCGIITGKAKEVINFRKKINAQKVALFTDIHVKHSKLLSKNNILQSAKLAIQAGSDALIVTGNLTGQAPNLSELVAVRKATRQFPILIGSGTDKNNIRELFKYANGAITATSLKQGSLHKGEVNVKKWQQRIDYKKVKELIKLTNH